MINRRGRRERREIQCRPAMCLVARHSLLLSTSLPAASPCRLVRLQYASPSSSAFDTPASVLFVASLIIS